MSDSRYIALLTETLQMKHVAWFHGYKQRARSKDGQLEVCRKPLGHECVMKGNLTSWLGDCYRTNGGNVLHHPIPRHSDVCEVDGQYL